MPATKGRAHGGRVLAAAAAAVALLEVAGEGAVAVDEAEHRCKRQHQLGAGAEPEIAVDAVAAIVDHLARVQHAGGVEDPLDRGRGRDELRSDLLLQVLGARDAEAVLGGQRPAEAPAKVRDLVGDPAQPRDVLGVVQVENRPHVELARRDVAVERRAQAEPVQDLLEPRHVRRQVARPHADILDAGDRLGNSIGFAFHHASHGDQETQLFGYLKEKQVLLLIDNLEHLLAEPGIELLAELLRHAPHVKLLVTSHECLGLQDEWVFEVQGLPVPESIYVEGTEQNTCVELFLQRARRAHVGYNFTIQDYPFIWRICQLVDGMPLGIELAPAWVRTLSCEEIAHEIERGLGFLAVSARDIPARHRSMRAVFEQSWKLLTEEEQRVLLRLSAFRGGFRREAAEQVAEATLSALSTLVT